MRTYYGKSDWHKKYIEDETHKLVAWKEMPYSFELTNRTEFKLNITSGKKDSKTLKPHETIIISCNRNKKFTIFSSSYIFLMILNSTILFSFSIFSKEIIKRFISFLCF